MSKFPSPGRACGWALIALACTPAFAGRPFTTEDASVLEDKACQLEAWIDRAEDASAGWMVPACNFGWGIEWQLGAARTREAGTSRFGESYFQGKGLLREMRDDSPWGIGLVVGAIRRPLQAVHRGWDNPYALVPASVAVNDAVTLHANVGGLRDRGAGRNLTLWGVAAEGAVHPRLTLLAEAYGENSERPFVRAGARYSAIPGRLDLDLSAVARPGGTRDERFLSIGFALVTDPFLP